MVQKTVKQNQQDYQQDYVLHEPHPFREQRINRPRPRAYAPTSRRRNDTMQ